MPENEASSDLVRARELSSSGQYRRSRRHFLAALDQEPSNPRILASLARVDAETRRTTFEQALATVVELIAQHPDDARLQAAATSLRYPLARTDKNERAKAVLELRGILTNYPDDAYVQQGLAGLLGGEKATQPEAWELYKSALDSGPLMTPCYRAAFYWLAKRHEPLLAERFLRGLSPVERAVVRTRSLTPIPMFAVLFVLAFSAVSVHSTGDLVWSVPLMTLATFWGIWCVYVNSVMCCKKCRNAWIGMIAWMSVIFLVAKGIRWYVWLLVGAVALAAMWLRGRENSKLADQISITAGQ